MPVRHRPPACVRRARRCTGEPPFADLWRALARCPAGCNLYPYRLEHTHLSRRIGSVIETGGHRGWSATEGTEPGEGNSGGRGCYWWGSCCCGGADVNVPGTVL